ncbi:MAG: hypothetical protein DMF95_35235 [Acidobacteria bacterium]|nr:MAG: hypothetical protein DMF94_14175 [Acidobacteriota bacterium]PYR39691.1 MAG: hypothetical protein DMF95_35235 [Acidobacteriota bacterium]
MKSLTLGLALALACSLSRPNGLLANAAGGHGGGGHSSGGHSSGGHSGGSHSGGGHSGGRSGGGHAGSSHAGGVSHNAAATTRSGGSVSTSGAGRAGARPRDGRPIVGAAVPRTTTIAPIVVTSFGTLPSRRWPYYSSAFGFGALGFYQNPLRSGYSYGGYPTYAQDPFDAAGPTGGLRLKVEPTDAEVYVDGYFAGIVDDFNGHFQRLKLTAGPHRIEVRAPGYQPLTFDISIQPRHTTEYRGALQR